MASHDSMYISYLLSLFFVHMICLCTLRCGSSEARRYWSLVIGHLAPSTIYIGKVMKVVRRSVRRVVIYDQSA